MARGDSSDKKMPATRRQLRLARERGEAPQSKDLTSAVVLAAWVVTGTIELGVFIKLWRELANTVLSDVAHPTPEVLTQSLWRCGAALSSSVAASLGPVAIIGLVVQFAQVGPVFAFTRVGFDPSRLSPKTWFEHFGQWEASIELLKGIAKQLLVVAIAYEVAAPSLPLIVSLSSGTPDAILPALQQVLPRLLAITAATGIGLGLLDLLYQRFAFQKKMRMSVADYRQDTKSTEGDPEIKAARKKLYREWLHHNAAEATREALVVVTNPTHYAVALKYDPSADPAPLVAAKGQDHLAAEIRNAAEAADVPIVPSPALARQLHERVEVGGTIPEDLFVVVAEVIVWASKLRRTMVNAETSTRSQDQADELA
jgi:type III secretion protein U